MFRPHCSVPLFRDDHEAGDRGRMCLPRLSGWDPEMTAAGAGTEGSRKEARRMGWEYEGLFDAEIRPEADDLLSGYWRSEPTAIRIGSMGYRTRTIKAGPRLEAEIYPLFGRRAEQQARAAKARITPEKQQRLNMERARRHFIRLADANFGEEDIHLTLTYTDAPAYERARKDVRNFLLKVKRIREKRGMAPLKYAGMIEGNDDGKRERIHIHLLMSGGIPREELEAIWAKGYANADRLRPDDSGLEAIARYIVKQQKNRKKWFASRNLTQPKSRTSDTKVSNARVKRIAHDFRNEAKEIMEKVYPGYRYVKCSVYYSDVVDGVYIRCVMRRNGRG